jgi:hypothetical protein
MVLLEIYNQVGRKKDLVIETILNGGVIPQQFQEEEKDPELEGLGDLVGIDDNPEADEATIQRQIAQIEKNTEKRKRRE